MGQAGTTTLCLSILLGSVQSRRSSVQISSSESLITIRFFRGFASSFAVESSSSVSSTVDVSCLISALFSDGFDFGFDDGRVEVDAFFDDEEVEVDGFLDDDDAAFDCCFVVEVDSVALGFALTFVVTVCVMTLIFDSFFGSATSSLSLRSSRLVTEPRPDWNFVERSLREAWGSRSSTSSESSCSVGLSSSLSPLSFVILFFPFPLVSTSEGRDFFLLLNLRLSSESASLEG